MAMDERERYARYFQEVEGEDFDKVIGMQIQATVRETARLVGLLEGGYRVAGIDSPEYASIRSTGSSFLKDLVDVARRLNVPLQ
ncbi:MAG: hypothetical protein JXA20_10310 [Spirochaetes bacterium]|nr:hypothetical protein [Spirochaetota bacterium]